ncbi:MAG: 3-phytase [Actinomycetota bacterium]|nr:3-phytase [Actinomycetota bacterium]
MGARALDTLTALAAAFTLTTGPLATAPAPTPVRVTATVETPAVHHDEAGHNADADDPAVWVDPRTPGRSIVLGTLKEAGLGAYSLDGRLLQHLPAPAAPGENAQPGRFNNVDVIYGFELGGQKTDLALVSDRGRDRIRAFAINPHAVVARKSPLREVTAPDVAPVFAQSERQVDEQRTSYGLTAFTEDDDAYVVVSQREESQLSLLRLRNRNGRIGYQLEQTLDLPDTFLLPDGTSWTPCADPGEHPQVEGMAVDQEEHVLYAAQETVGLWRIELRDGKFATPRLIDRVREFGTPWTYDATEEECVPDAPTPDTPASSGPGGEHLSADVEGVTVYHAADGTGYVLASSQGDNTFAVYERSGRNRYVGSFRIADGVTDGVQHSDGSTVINVPLGRAFPRGLLITHDGEATPTGADQESSNFKYLRWDRLATAFPEPLTIDTESFDPRDPN